MFDFLKSKSWPIALDMGSGGVRMLQLKTSGSHLVAVASGQWKYPPEAMEMDLVQRRALAVEAVRDMLKRGGFHGRNVVSSLPTAQLAIKNIRLPHAGEEELAAQILAEARERLGFEVKPDRLSFLNAGQVRQGAEMRDEIILIGAEAGVIDTHLTMLEEMGLRPMHVDAEPVAMFRSFERFLRRTADEQAVSVAIDVGLSGTRVVIARGRQIIFIKNIEIGGRRFNEAVAKQLGLSYQETSDLRMRSARERPGQGEGGEDPNSMQWTICDALRAEVQNLAREIALCVRYCSVTFRNLHMQCVNLVGGESYDAAVVHLLSENLGMPVLVAQPLRGVDTSAVELGSDRRGTLTEWAICAGLAVRCVDLSKTDVPRDSAEDDRAPAAGAA